MRYADRTCRMVIHSLSGNEEVALLLQTPRVRPPVAGLPPSGAQPRWRGSAGTGRVMDPEASPPNVDRLVLLATLSAVAESLPRKRRLQLVARLLSIAADWERKDNVIDLRAPRRRPAQDEAMQAAPGRLRTTAQLLEPPAGPEA